jgi:hypothetical protein
LGGNDGGRLFWCAAVVATAATASSKYGKNEQDENSGYANFDIHNCSLVTTPIVNAPLFTVPFTTRYFVRFAAMRLFEYLIQTMGIA